MFSPDTGSRESSCEEEKVEERLDTFEDFAYRKNTIINGDREGTFYSPAGRRDTLGRRDTVGTKSGSNPIKVLSEESTEGPLSAHKNI
jgi:hypothetical protein